MGARKKVRMDDQVVETLSPRQARPQMEVPSLQLPTLIAPINVVAEVLQRRLTQRLTAYIVGLSDGRDIGRYVRQEREPHASNAIKMRSLFELLNTILKDENDQIIQLWFQGQNSELKGEAPAQALRDDFLRHFPAVRIAALKLVELSRK